LWAKLGDNIQRASWGASQLIGFFNVILFSVSVDDVPRGPTSFWRG
jgi:hypothetical protein